MVPCECFPDCTASGQYATDRNGRNWCKWCHGNGLCTDMDGHYAPPKTKEHAMATKFPCPKCGQTDNLHFYERLDGAALTVDGFWIEKGKVKFEFEGRTEPLWDTQESIGLVCINCGWTYAGKDWEDYVVNFEVREQERIKREFLREIGQLPPDEETDERPAASTWEVPLEPGKIKIVVPVVDGHQPMILTADMNEMDEPKDIHIDPHARTVSFKSKEPLVEVCDECEIEVPEGATTHEGDWHKPFCSLFTEDFDNPGPRGRERMRPATRAKAMAGDAPEIMGTRKVYVYVTDKDDTRRLEQSLTAKQVALSELAAINWNSDDDYDGTLAVSFDVPKNITDDEIHDWFTQVGMSAEISDE